MNPMDTGTVRALQRAHDGAIAQMRKERADSIAWRLVYGAPADVESGVADVLDRRRVSRTVVPS